MILPAAILFDMDGTLTAPLLDFPAIMKEAEKIGVKHYYIEDEAANAAEQIPVSVKFLQGLR